MTVVLLFLVVPFVRSLAVRRTLGARASWILVGVCALPLVGTLLGMVIQGVYIPDGIHGPGEALPPGIPVYHLAPGALIALAAMLGRVFGRPPATQSVPETSGLNPADR